MNGFLVGLVFAQTQFVSVLGGEQEERLWDIAVTSDSGFAVAGYSTSFDIDHSMDIIVSRFDRWGNHLWTRTQGTRDLEEAFRVVATENGGVVILGAYGETAISQFDANGNLIWAKVLDVFGGSGGGISMCMIPTQDQGFVLAGGVIEVSPGFYDLLIMRLDQVGIPLWARTVKVWRPTINEYATHIIQASDGGFIMVGALEQGLGDPEPPFNPDIIISKFDPSGNHLWTRLIRRNREDYEHAVGAIPTPDGGVIVAGTISQLQVETQDVIAFKVDGSGNLTWETSLSTADADVAFSLVPTPDGGFAVAGGTGFRFMGSDYDVFLSKFDSYGNHLWTRTFGKSSGEWADQVIAIPNGNLIVAGPTWSFGAGDCDIMLSGFDGEGNHLWSWVAGGSARDWGDYALRLIPAPDGGFVVGSVTMSFGAGDYDFILVKYDGAGKTCIGEPIEPVMEETRWGASGIGAIDPDPTITSITPVLWNINATSVVPSFTPICSSLRAEESTGSHGLHLTASGRLIRFTLSAPQEIVLSVYDPTGRLVAKPANSYVNAGEHELKLDLQKGVYFVELKGKGFIVRTKTTIL